MAHDLAAAARHLDCLDRALERLDPMLGDDVLGHAHLDSERDVGVFGHRTRGGLDLRKVDVEELSYRESGQADVGDVDESVKARARRRDNEASVRSKTVCA